MNTKIENNYLYLSFYFRVSSIFRFIPRFSLKCFNDLQFFFLQFYQFIPQYLLNLLPKTYRVIRTFYESINQIKYNWKKIKPANHEANNTYCLHKQSIEANKNSIVFKGRNELSPPIQRSVESENIRLFLKSNRIITQAAKFTSITSRSNHAVTMLYQR